jgi:hypothetical protein
MWRCCPGSDIRKLVLVYGIGKQLSIHEVLSYLQKELKLRTLPDWYGPANPDRDQIYLVLAESREPPQRPAGPDYIPASFTRRKA